MTIRARFRVQYGEFSLDAALDLPDRGITALFGRSGTGKTTLLRALAGLDRHSGGWLEVAGQTWQAPGRFLPPHKRGVGYVFQEPSLFAHLSVRGNLEYASRRVPVRDRRVDAEHAAGLLGIRDLMERRPAHLSGGERQRVAIARALAANPRLLLMDEPMAALDDARKNEILPYIASLPKALDIPVIYVSHSRDEVARIANHLVLLDAGRVQAAGPIGDMLTRLDLPLAHGNDAEALFQGSVTGHDSEYDLTYIDFPGGRFSVPRKDLPVGSMVRLRVAARDVSLTLAPQTGTSILNIFPARIEAAEPEGSAQVMLRLLAGGVPLLSRVTRKSAVALQLTPGRQVYAQVKSVALLT